MWLDSGVIHDDSRWKSRSYPLFPDGSFAGPAQGDQARPYRGEEQGPGATDTPQGYSSGLSSRD